MLKRPESKIGHERYSRLFQKSCSKRYIAVTIKNYHPQRFGKESLPPVYHLSSGALQYAHCADGPDPEKNMAQVAAFSERKTYGALAHGKM